MKTLCSFAVQSQEPQEARTGHVLDRSDAGFFLASNTLYPPGTALSLVMELPESRVPVRMRGSVSWARTADPAGMFITLAAADDEAGRAERNAAVSADAAKTLRGAEPISS